MYSKQLTGYPEHFFRGNLAAPKPGLLGYLRLLPFVTASWLRGDAITTELTLSPGVAPDICHNRPEQSASGFILLGRLNGKGLVPVTRMCFEPTPGTINQNWGVARCRYGLEHSPVLRLVCRSSTGMPVVQSGSG